MGAEQKPNQISNPEGPIKISPIEGALSRISQMQYTLDELEDITVEEADHYGAPGCKNPSLRKRFIQYEYHYKLDRTNVSDPTGSIKGRVTIGRSLPGWECGDCHTQLHVGSIDEEFRTIIAEGLADGGDTKFKEELEEKRKQEALKNAPRF